MKSESQLRTYIKNARKKTSARLDLATRVFVKVDAAVCMPYETHNAIYNIATAGLGPCLALTYYYDQPQAMHLLAFYP